MKSERGPLEMFGVALVCLGLVTAVACKDGQTSTPTAPSQTGSFGTFLKYETAANVPSSELTAVQTGILEVQTLFEEQVGGDIPITTQMAITVLGREA